MARTFADNPWAKRPKPVTKCPFCGEDERRLVKLRTPEGDTAYAVQCTKCMARGPIVTDPSRAGAVWSTREEA